MRGETRMVYRPSSEALRRKARRHLVAAWALSLLGWAVLGVGFAWHLDVLNVAVVMFVGSLIETGVHRRAAMELRRRGQ
ncbi:MAG: hypothetical protein NUW01_03740 [Gemmatimonadaceae bacterium]|nr:hypothetical protein [Gemmatimonadaceae bacterium]